MYTSIVNRHVHSMWIIAAVSSGVIVGIITSQHIPFIWFYSLWWLVFGLLIVIYSLWRPRVYVIIFVFAAGCFVGLWRGSVEQQKLSVYHNVAGSVIDIRGTLADDVDKDKHGRLVLRLKNCSREGKALPGTIWVSLAVKDGDLKRSDNVTVRGRIVEGFGGFSASMHRADLIKNERQKNSDIAMAVRDWFAAQVRHVIPEPEASLGIGFLTGQRRALPEELDEALRVSGLMHIVVASGYNLTILVRLARRLFAKISRYGAVLSASFMIIAFMGVTGLSPSMSRAGLVAGLSVCAWYYGRSVHPLVLLPFAAAITLLIQPAYGWNDLGWQLSFAAFAGVMIVAPLMQQYFYGNKKPGTIRQILGETLAAWACTLPLLMAAFGEFSNVAIIANILVLPFLPLAMLLTFIAGLGVVLWPIAGEVVGAIAQNLLHYMVTVATYLAQVPWAITAIEVPAWIPWVMYFAMAGFCVYAWRKTGYSLSDSNIIK